MIHKTTFNFDDTFSSKYSVGIFGNKKVLKLVIARLERCSINLFYLFAYFMTIFYIHVTLLEA